MELDITDFATTKCAADYHASVAEIGEGAGKRTWQAAVECRHMFVTRENRQEFVNHFKGYGAWSEGEINDWPDTELNALVIQEISGQIREFSDNPVASWDWDDYQRQCEAGQIQGLLFKAGDEIYCTFDM